MRKSVRFLIGALAIIFVNTSLAKESSSALVLLTPDNKNIGFALFSPEHTAEKGDCVLMVMLENPSLMERQNVKRLNELKTKGEFQWVRTSNGLKVTQGQEAYLIFKNDGEVVSLPNEKLVAKWIIAK